MITAFIIGVSLDLVIGDPRWIPHPIRGIGLLIQRIEQLLRRIRHEKIAGCLLVCGVLLTTVGVVMFSLQWAGAVAATYWIFTSLAVRSLDDDSHAVIDALRRGE